MKRSRVWIRALLGTLLVAACLAAALLPVLPFASAAPASIVTSQPPGDIVISQFRFEGSAGASDEFVEIFNRSCTDKDLSGWEMRYSNGQTSTPFYEFPSPTTLAAGHYYLIVGPQYDATANKDGVYSTTVGGVASTGEGVAIFSSNDPNNVTPVDAVGLGAGVDAFYEGTGIDAANPAPTVDQSYSRLVATGGTFPGAYVDTNNNAKDFAPPAASTPRYSGSPAGTCGIPTVTISGNAGIAGATLSYTDVTAKTATTDSSGNYTFTVPANWSGTLTPGKLGYAFTPASKAFASVMGDTTQNFVAAVASTFNPRVMINEVAYYGTLGNSGNDWIELYNTTGSDIDLSEGSGWVLEAQDGVPSIPLRGIIPAHGYYLLANGGSSSYATTYPTAASTPACFVFKQSDNVKIDQFFTGDLYYGGETLFLLNPIGAVEDQANRNGGTWPAGSTSNSRSMERSGIVPDSDTAWFTYADTTPNFVHDCAGNRVYGTPGRPNWAITVTITPSPVPTKFKTATPRPPTPFGHVVINEYLPRAGFDWNQDGAVDVFDEFIEIKNLGPVSASLSGWRLDVISPGGPSAYTLPAATLRPGERLVYYSLKSHISLYDSGGTVRLINNHSVVVDARTYGPVGAPDVSHCRIPDGAYWQTACFPTPGNENALTGTTPAPPPAIASQPAPCVMADTVPQPFRQAECNPFGAGIYNPDYWDSQSGFKEFTVPDVLSKHRAVVQ